MKFIIFGAGGTGSWVFKHFGRNKVYCFADNNAAGEYLYDRRIISYQEMLEEYTADKSIIIVIASEKHWEEMEEQIKKDDVKRYFVFRETDLCHMNAVLPWYYLYQRPVYFSYKQILANYDIENYGKVAVYGVNEFLPYLLIEIMEKNPDVDIKVIRQNNYNGTYKSFGFEEIGFEQGIIGIDALLINSKQNEDNVRFEVSSMTEKSFDVLDLFDMDDFEPEFQHKELEIYKNIHKGKRIFVIGSGPSLRIEDLDTLHQNHEICIASNFTYRAYSMTSWRADYYCIGDGEAIKLWEKDQPDMQGEVFLGDSYHYFTSAYNKNAHYFHRKNEAYYPNPARFSDDLTKGLYDGATVTYLMIQLAAYMGAKEIFLLGVDHGWKEGAKLSETHFIKDYLTEDDKVTKYNRQIYRKDSIGKAYEGAELYSRKHDFRIYNATRGGYLEVFERVDFDSLFKDS